MTRLVYGVGINDSNCRVTRHDSARRQVWMCPFYRTWRGMLERCYSCSFLQQHPTYRACIVVPEWHRFSTFKKWMETQDWEGKQLDKDLLIRGNKTYGPDACIFISKEVNLFMLERTNGRGDFPIGVYWDKTIGKFVAQCSNPLTARQQRLGRFDCPNEAHQAWLKQKQLYASILAEKQTEAKVASAILQRYSNYKESHN